MSATLPPPAKLTPDDLLRLPDRGKGFELVDGELKELERELPVQLRRGRGVRTPSRPRPPPPARLAVPRGTSYRCFPIDPDRVRRADVAFHLLNRLTPDQALTEGHLAIVPDLVVEVVSPNDLADEVNAKRVEWLAAGAALVWVVFPVQQEVHAFRADGSSAVFRRTDTLTAGPVLPDFRVPVTDLFRLPAAV